MVGREVADALPEDAGTESATWCSRCEGLTTAGVFHDVSLHGARPARSSVSPGWSAPAAARSPARSSASTATTRARSPSSGTRRTSPIDPRAAIKAGIAFVPEDRRKQGLVIEALGRPQRHRRHPLRADPRRPAHLVRRERAPPRRGPAGSQVKTGALDMHAAHDERRQPAEGRASPSGWPPSPRLLIIDEPTRGIDVGTKAEVHRLLSELAGQGMAILMISSELPEVLGMADRVLVVREGRDHRRPRPRRRHPRDRDDRRHPATHRAAA